MRRDRSWRILAKGVSVSNDSFETKLNNNTLLIGTTGSGKTRSYVIPNILASEGSIVVSDTKGDLYDKLHEQLEAKGYRTLYIDFTDCLHSPTGYNPLSYIRIGEDDLPNEQDMLSIAKALVPDTKDEPFWGYAARDLFNSLLGYTMTYLPAEEHNLVSICRLFDTVADGRYEMLIDEVAEEAPYAFAVTHYAIMKSGKEAEKMIGSIRGVCSGELSHYRFDGAKRLFTMENQVCFEALRYQKTALFVHISDVDRSMDRLVALFYEQLFRILIKTKERKNQPFYPVHVILDDFACGCRVADFESIISVIRSRGIYVSTVIQSIAQLETKYKERSSTIVENCDTVLYLGGNDPQTARLIAERSNKPVHEILSMPVGDMLLIQRGQPVRKVKRYALEEHCEVIDRASERREEMTGMENEGICV